MSLKAMIRTAQRRQVLEAAKDELRKLFGRDEKD
jgi:hypothetical protein